jgi:hypothetical protein
MMKDSERSTKLGPIVLLVLAILVIFNLLMAVSLGVASGGLDDHIELRARCKSLGGEAGYSKCYKDGKEI